MVVSDGVGLIIRYAIHIECGPVAEFRQAIGEIETGVSLAGVVRLEIAICIEGVQPGMLGRRSPMASPHDGKRNSHFEVLAHFQSEFVTPGVGSRVNGLIWTAVHRKGGIGPSEPVIIRYCADKNGIPDLP